MPLKTYRPTSSSRRGLVLVDRSKLWRGRPVKALTRPLHSSGGRNSRGRVTVRSRGGRHKRLMRVVDFRRAACDAPARVERLEYDPNRTAFVALVRYGDGRCAYILAPHGLDVGDEVSGALSGGRPEIKLGNAVRLRDVPDGALVHNVEMKPGKGGQLARSAGSYAQVVARDGDYTILTLSSGVQYKVLSACAATIGSVSNPDHANVVCAKAGRSRWRGVRPLVRGIAKNPVDHPHGGRTNGGRHPVTPWGQPTKGKKTRRNKSTGKYILRGRRHKKRR